MESLSRLVGEVRVVPAAGPPRPLLVAFGHRSGVGRSVAASAVGGWRGSVRFDGRARAVAIRDDPGVETVDLAQLVERDGWAETLRRSRPAREWLRTCVEETRSQGPEVWLAHAGSEWNIGLEHFGRPLAFADLRFPDEAEFIRSKGGLVVRVDRPGVGPSDDPFDDALAGWEDWDHVFVNDSTREALENAVRAVLLDAWDEDLVVGPDDLEPGVPVRASAFDRKPPSGGTLSWYSSVVVEGPCGDCSAHHAAEVDVDDEGNDFGREYLECFECGKKLWYRVRVDVRGNPEADGLYHSWDPSAAGVPR